MTVPGAQVDCHPAEASEASPCRDLLGPAPTLATQYATWIPTLAALVRDDRAWDGLRSIMTWCYPYLYCGPLETLQADVARIGDPEQRVELRQLKKCLQVLVEPGEPEFASQLANLLGQRHQDA